FATFQIAQLANLAPVSAISDLPVASGKEAETCDTAPGEGECRLSSSGASRCHFSQAPPPSHCHFSQAPPFAPGDERCASGYSGRERWSENHPIFRYPSGRLPPG